MSTDWNKLNEEYKPKYKDFAPEGEHHTKVAAAVQVESSQKKTPGIQFTFEDNDNYSFPKFGVTHWLSFKNEGWRKHHFKELMVVLGAKEADAEKAVDTCEDKGDQDKIVKAYALAFKRLADKHPEVDIAVYKDDPADKYTRCDFASNTVRMNRPEAKKADSTDVFDEAEEASDISDDDLPF